MRVVSLSWACWSLGQRDWGQPTLGGGSSTRGVEQQELWRLVWAAGCSAGFSREWQDFAQLSLTNGAVVGVSLEQKETAQASADAFLTDLVLSRETLRRRRRFCAVWSLVMESLLLLESNEMPRVHADDFPEHCFPSSDCRSRISQQVSWPRAMRARQIHPRVCRVAP